MRGAHGETPLQNYVHVHPGGRTRLHFGLDTFVTFWFIRIGKFEFFHGYFEDCALNEVCFTSSKLKVAMVSGAAGLNKVFVLDSNHRQAVADQSIRTAIQLSTKRRELNFLIT